MTVNKSDEKHIEYRVNAPITTEQFLCVLHSSGLAERRPVDDVACIEGMINNSNLTLSAWDGEKLVGIARNVTDFHYACYLSDLAVDREYQSLGIGKQLQVLTKKALGPKCKLILIAAPAANTYYKHIGFNHNERCWVLEPTASIKD
ncbi:GNAT family N-acetyltransferase [Alteromonas facilis]|uniref:GNAT family N-acetyltransferase n=1 Tax=Alteromonas facilis TaxID=2048004 RepID=UPI000C29154B|nr:GNAT family N-acetyltransferase [Alteromonas facilis]